MAMRTELPTFGSEFGRKEWSFEAGWLNVNHGSYGAAPNSVISAFRKIQDRSAAAPDRFIRAEYEIELKALRARLAELVRCDAEDLVTLSNATTGVNVVLRSLTGIWEKGDKLLYYSTTIYDACSSTLQFIVDTHPHLGLSLVPIPLVYPLSHDEVIETTRRVIAQENNKGNGRIRLALFDAISSNPGVIVPWERLVTLFKSNSILSLVDAAHQIGQLPTNLRASQPDFWLSNCHKWLLSHRGCAVLYVAKQFQYLIHSEPIANSYKIRQKSIHGNPEWVNEFAWNGTIDWSPVLSIDAALDFRIACGGEARINEYCHNLAVKGGERVAVILGTEVMRNTSDEEGELIANMVNVRLPITLPSETSPLFSLHLSQQKKFLYGKLMSDHATQAPGFLHDGKWWARFSAQIYNDVEQFEEVARRLKSVCERIEKGEHLV